MEATLRIDATLGRVLAPLSVSDHNIGPGTFRIELVTKALRSAEELRIRIVHGRVYAEMVKCSPCR
ncbi:hypothetical protein V1291_000836 [Nitrobacteraceae bacterium AZCC 1564]